MEIFSKDDFFKNASELRNIALGMDWSTWTVQEKPIFGGGWRGARSAELSTYKNPILDKAIKEVYTFAWEVMDLPNYTYPEWDNWDNLKEDGSCEYLPGRKIKDPEIKAYFHMWRTKSNKGYQDWWARYHQDFIPAAGVVYLNYHAPKDAGTSIIDCTKNQIINVENLFNRFVVYDGYYPHGVSKSFGNGKEDSRLTFNFFIKCKGIEN
tara:strand:- start:866 stop:1492 length:627 start_codon:yes stop_codon:yes gene_type:complete